MAFVYQKLTEEDKKYLNSFRVPFQYGGIGGVRYVDDEAPVDRKRNIFLYYVGGLGNMREKEDHPPAVYYFVWDGDLIKFALYVDHTKRDKNNKRIYNFDIFTVIAPKKFEKIEEELIEAIKEAIIENEKGDSITAQFFGSVESIIVDKPLYVSSDVREIGV